MGDQLTTFFDGLARWAADAAPRFVAAILILIVGIWFAGWCARTVRRLADHQKFVDETLVGVLSALVRYGILAVVLVAVLGQLGVATTSIIAVLGAAGLAIGLALQGTLQNIAAGIMLLWLRPFRVGDYIDTGSIAGTVKEIGLFASEVHTWDGLYVFAPNSELWNRKVINYSRLPTRLAELKFAIAYSDDIGKAREVLTQMVKSDPRVLADPEPNLFVSALGDSAVEISVRVWTARADYFPVLRQLTERGKTELEAAGLSIPFPQRDLHLYGLDRTPGLATGGQNGGQVEGQVGGQVGDQVGGQDEGHKRSSQE